MTDETQTEIATEEPQTEAPAAEEQAPVAIVQDTDPTTKKIFKPHGEEFSYDVDFAAVAAALNLPIDQVEFSIIEDNDGNIDGKSLVGTPKA